MAHFAQVEDGIVRQAIAVANDALDPNDEEASGQAMLAASGFDGVYIQCSYTGSMRGAYPGPGWKWDGENFIPPPQNDL